MDIRDKNVLVFGSGISGIAASRLLLREGADVSYMMEMRSLMQKPSKKIFYMMKSME